MGSQTRPSRDDAAAAVVVEDDMRGPAPATVSLHPASGARLTAIETQVIALGRGDSLASLTPPGPVARAIAALFGVGRRTAMLADARLETLRRAVVVTHHRRHMPDRTAAELAAIGFWPAQIRVIEALSLGG